jgi:hypothetical protein
MGAKWAYGPAILVACVALVNVAVHGLAVGGQ